MKPQTIKISELRGNPAYQTGASWVERVKAGGVFRVTLFGRPLCAVVPIALARQVLTSDVLAKWDAEQAEVGP
jgi:antitoxin (DNA-binding transcriptional repressor) of toxin-antitoxin stability system